MGVHHQYLDSTTGRPVYIPSCAPRPVTAAEAWQVVCELEHVLKHGRFPNGERPVLSLEHHRATMEQMLADMRPRIVQ